MNKNSANVEINISLTNFIKNDLMYFLLYLDKYFLVNLKKDKQLT